MSILQRTLGDCLFNLLKLVFITFFVPGIIVIGIGLTILGLLVDILALIGWCFSAEIRRNKRSMRPEERFLSRIAFNYWIVKFIGTYLRTLREFFCGKDVEI